MIDLSTTKSEELNEVCPNSCTEIGYETMSKTIPHDLSDMALISMYYQSNHLRLLEEYLIFDFSSILVAIGGSLGLFLGFSFFQCGTEFCLKLMDIMNKLLQKNN